MHKHFQFSLRPPSSWETAVGHSRPFDRQNQGEHNCVHVMARRSLQYGFAVWLNHVQSARVRRANCSCCSHNVKGEVTRQRLRSGPGIFLVNSCCVRSVSACGKMLRLLRVGSTRRKLQAPEETRPAIGSAAAEIPEGILRWPSCSCSSGAFRGAFPESALWVPAIGPPEAAASA